MSRAWSAKRARLFEAAAGAPPDADLVGRDFKRPVGARRTRRGSAGGWWLPALVGALAAALLLVALRNSILALRYDLDAAIAQEMELMKDQRAATAELRTLRDPARLQGLARERGFVRPDRVIDLGREVARP